METYDTIIIGGGQAGLALSRTLTDAGVEHVVLERGRLAERWRSERWDSLRMLTPNWMTRLPGRPGQVRDPDGFMSKDDLVDMLESYAASFGAPVREQTEVTEVSETPFGFFVATNRGVFESRNVVLATGQTGRPAVPKLARQLDTSLRQLHASRYRNPDEMADGGVLVVGAGASGLQIAAELRAAGRDVILATGRHARAVRRYRGRDLWWWLDAMGSLDETVDEVGDIEAARRTPSLGLTGADGGGDIDLGSLEEMGVQVAGRVLAARGPVVEFGDELSGNAMEAEVRLRRLLDRFDAWAHDRGLDDQLGAPMRPMPVRIRQPLSGELDLSAAGVGTVLWATGYRQSYPWLSVPVLDGQGEVVHRRGVTEVPGLYVLGLRFQWTRGSHFVDGVGRDAEYLADRIFERSVVAAVA
ncbi:MAG TPA: NAD(P)-binding domain-containing protein [Acidimicrobiia bacterium]|nr:NAD(P)-binding domain-containing protein [Acidimicrobiia bacterium]